LNILFVTIVEIHTLILDVCVCPKEAVLSEQLLRNPLGYLDYFGSYAVK